jgi:hypothetical protein
VITNGRFERSKIEAARREVTKTFDRLGIRWAIAGALAAERYRAEERVTKDADLLVEWHDQLIVSLEALGYELKVARDEGEVHLIRARKEGVGVDVIVATTEYQREAIARAFRRRLTIEDVLIHKLIAWRPKDRDDIASILSTDPQFDRDFVERWAAEWDVTDRWREAQGWR